MTYGLEAITIRAQITGEQRAMDEAMMGIRI